MNLLNEYIKSSDVLTEIYNELIEEGVSISLEVSDNLDDGILGTCNFESKCSYAKIKIRSNSINEDVISHELLHAYLLINRFPSVRTATDDISIKNIGKTLINSVSHSLISDLQSDLNIDSSEYNLFHLNDILNRDNQDNTISLDIFDLMMRCYNSNEWNQYEKLIKEKHPSSYSDAEKLYSLTKKYDLHIQFEYRKALIAILKAVSTKDSNNNSIPINQNFQIDYIPSNEELDLNVEDVFKLERIESQIPRYVLISKIDNQLSYSFPDIKSEVSEQEVREKILSAKLRDFYKATNIIYTTS